MSDRARSLRDKFREHRRRHEAERQWWREGPRQVNRIRCYLRARMHRRIFIHLGVTIMFAGLMAYGVMALFGGAEWKRDVDGARSFVMHRFAESWTDESKRVELAAQLHEDLNVDVTVRGPDGAVLDSVGDTCSSRASYRVPIENQGRELGTVEVCSDRFARRQISSIAAILAACFALWLIAAAMSRKITRSVYELERAALEIGRGNYEPEIRISPHAPGEMLLLGDALRDMGAKIKAQVAEQRELLASVSHEIRSPLARIRLLLELSRNPELAEEEEQEETPDLRAERLQREKAFNDMEREIEEIDEMVGGLLANSRVDFSALSRRPIDAEEASKRALDRAGVRADLRVTGEKKPLEADATLFARAMANLLENADAHGGGAERVDVEYTDASVHIEVLDRGPGLEPGEEDKIFQSFYRRPSKAHESLGLGLALVRKIAEAHGGGVFARNRDGGGAAIGFEMPLPPVVRD